jgi:hypothetical protein
LPGAQICDLVRRRRDSLQHVAKPGKGVITLRLNQGDLEMFDESMKPSYSVRAYHYAGRPSNI